MTTLPPEVRFAKHRLLSEIGPVGQQALCASTCVLPVELGDLAREAAHTYLERSGVSVISPPHARREAASEACLAELEGALVALAHVQAVLQVGTPLTISAALRAGAKTR